MDISNGQKVELWATSNKVQLFWEGHKNLKKTPTTGRRFFQIFSTSHNFLTLITVEEIWKSIRSPKWFAMLLFLSRIRETSLNLELFAFVKIRKIVKKMISWAAGTRDLPFLGFGGLEIDCRTFQPGAFSTPKFKPKSFNPRVFFYRNPPLFVNDFVDLQQTHLIMLPWIYYPQCFLPLFFWSSLFSIFAIL